MNEYRKNKLGNETYTQITTLQGLIDICNGIHIDAYKALYIRINQGKYLEFHINIKDLTNLSFTYNNVTYVFGVDFTDVYVVFEGIETLISYQEGGLIFPTVGDLLNSYLNVIDADVFIPYSHLYTMLNIHNKNDGGAFSLSDLTLSDTRIGVNSIW